MRKLWQNIWKAPCEEDHDGSLATTPLPWLIQSTGFYVLTQNQDSEEPRLNITLPLPLKGTVLGMKNSIPKVIKRLKSGIWRCLMPPGDSWWGCGGGLGSRTRRKAFKHSMRQIQRHQVSPTGTSVLSVRSLTGRGTEGPEGHQRWTSGGGTERTVVWGLFPVWQRGWVQHLLSHYVRGTVTGKGKRM